MEPELAAIDKLLEDDEWYKQIKYDFGQRYPKRLQPVGTQIRWKCYGGC